MKPSYVIVALTVVVALLVGIGWNQAVTIEKRNGEILALKVRIQDYDNKLSSLYQAAKVATEAVSYGTRGEGRTIALVPMQEGLVFGVFENGQKMQRFIALSNGKIRAERYAKDNVTQLSYTQGQGHVPEHVWKGQPVYLPDQMVVQ